MARDKKRPQPVDPTLSSEAPGVNTSGSDIPNPTGTEAQASMAELEAAEARVEELQQELDKMSKQAAENFEGWQRERADFLNYRKRIERDQAQMIANTTGDIVRKYLVVLDDFERALKARPQGTDVSWAEGIELIYRKFKNVLDSEGVARIEAENTMFDPSLHEAITQEDSPNHESGEIIEVVQQGYKIGDRVIRPALVRVAR